MNQDNDIKTMPYRNTKAYREMPYNGNNVEVTDLTGYVPCIINGENTGDKINPDGKIYMSYRNKHFTSRFKSNRLYIFKWIEDKDKVFKQLPIMVAKLVLLHFDDNFKKKYKNTHINSIPVVINHKDGNPFNCNINNLEWIERSTYRTVHKGKKYRLKNILTGKTEDYVTMRDVSKVIKLTPVYLSRLKTKLGDDFYGHIFKGKWVIEKIIKSK